MKKIDRPTHSDSPSASSGTPLSSRPPPASSRPTLQARDRILYVEDEDQNWIVAELRLRRSYDLIRASTDREACAAIIEHGDKLTAILMDIQLRGSTLDGIKLTRLLRGRLDRADLPAYAQEVPTLDLPVIFVTAYSARYSEAELVAAGGNKLITKPVDFVQLTSAITQLRMQRIMDLGRKPQYG